MIYASSYRISCDSINYTHKRGVTVTFVGALSLSLSLSLPIQLYISQLQYKVIDAYNNGDMVTARAAQEGTASLVKVHCTSVYESEYQGVVNSCKGR
jgi:hypothetical protein